MISRETILQSKQLWCQVKQTEGNIGIYCERIYHLLANIDYIFCPPDAFLNRADGFVLAFGSIQTADGANSPHMENTVVI